MLVVIPFHAGDAVAVQELLNWIKELGAAVNHEALLVADAGTDWSDCRELLGFANKVFRKADLITTAKSVSGWPNGANSLFFTAAEHVKQHKRGHWFWLEPDAIPIRTGWVDLLEMEWLGLKHGQQFLGDFYDGNLQGKPRKFCSGVAVYSENAIDLLAPFKEQVGAWDVTAADVMLSKGAPSSMIQHFWGEKDLPPTFSERRESNSPVNTFTLWNIRPDTAVFHRNKDGTLINLLRKRLQTTAKEEVYKGPKSFLQMGRFGDIILLLPAFHEWSKRTGFNTQVITSEEHASVFEGVSYVDAIPLNFHWFHELNKARRWAEIEFPGCITTQLHGANWCATPDDEPSYSWTMWKRTGLLPEYHKLPLIFDKRDPAREKALLDRVNRARKPMLLVNWSGHTSPFACVPEVMEALNVFRGHFITVNLGELRAHRIYDLLGLIDNAIGLITIDTSTLHLAAASPKPYIAFVRDDNQSGSIPKGNCSLKIGYSKSLDFLPAITETVRSWIK